MAQSLTGFESDILESWESWQDDNVSSFSFYEAKLKVQLSPEFPAGRVVKFINFDLGNNILSIHEDGGEVFSCKLRLLPVLDG